MASLKHKIVDNQAPVGAAMTAASFDQCLDPALDTAGSPARELQAMLARHAVADAAVPGSRREQIIFIAAASAVLWGSIIGAALLFSLAQG